LVKRLEEFGPLEKQRQRSITSAQIYLGPMKSFFFFLIPFSFAKFRVSF